MTTATPVSLRSGRALTPMQRSLWMSQRKAPEAPAQNTALLTHIDGPVDVERLAAAFAIVVESSDVLRSTFHDDRGSASIRIARTAQPSTTMRLDRSEVATWAAERARTKLDLTSAAYDSVIIQHEDATVSWFLDLHHTITDATSSALVFDYTAQAYRGETVEIPSYYAWADDVASSLLGSSAVVGRAQSHWRERTSPPRIRGLYRPHDENVTDADRLQIDVSPELNTAIQSAIDGPYRLINDDLSWTALLTTVTSVHLHRVAGASAFSIGIPVHNRRTPAARTQLGPLMEVFPVDVEIVPGDTFSSLHQRVTRSVLTTLRNAIPGTAPRADYQAVVNVTPRAAFGSFGALATTTSWIHPGAIDAGHLLRVQRTAYADELVVDINAGAMPPSNVADPAAHLERILAASVLEPDQEIDVESLCTDAERQVLASWESGPAKPDRVDVSEQISAGLKTDQIVLVHGDRTWTGHELEVWIDRLAGWLIDEGVGPGRRVGIEMPRSAEAVATIAAVLAAGGSYVPLDPTQPEQRRKRLAARAGCHMIIDVAAVERATTDLAGTLTSGQARTDNLPSSEAYLLFTSGTTGEPKGVPITRGGLSDYLAFAASHYLDQVSRPVVALFGSLTFDLTVTSLFLPLVSGGQSVVLDEDGPAAIAALAKRRDVNWCKATPSHLEILQRLLPPDHSIRTFVVGGEAFRTDLADRLIADDPSRGVYNEYGPTEAVVGCMIHRHSLDTPGADVPIGRPLPGVRLRIVDPKSNRVPIGAAGELCVASEGLTAGYLDDPPNDPFVTLDGVRFYRTGDLVRLVDDNTAIYLGRIDEQIKVGGIRLEPSEVEAALTEHRAVASAAVRVWTPTHRTPAFHCVRCGLADNVPGIEFDGEGVCSTCRAFEVVAPAAASWFGTEDDLRALRDRARTRRKGQYDCLHLLSGGKDSTYALYRLIELGFEPYVLTLDNGFISEQAKANIARTVDDLGIDHEFATTPAMNEIFRDSLERHANVCHGCYKTIYTLATTRAAELGIPMIVTGLSRGQLFETRLVPQQFALDRFDPTAIDRAVLQARKAYHRIDDAPRRLLDTSVFDSDQIFDDVEYVDIYRYIDVPLQEMLSFLDREAPWVRPSDTGRSTNCRINDVGIQTHLVENGYHNYAVPYAWDVRLGHKTREDALEELDDRLDQEEIGQMLAEVGYQPRVRSILTAWIELVPGADRPSPAELRGHLGELLPAHAIPSAFVVVEQLPLGNSGKLDTSALPAPHLVNRTGPALHVEASTPTQAMIVKAWERVLDIEPIGIDDDFFALGGDSLAALEMIIALGDELGRTIREDLAFVNTTPRQLADAIDAAGASEAPLVPPPPAAHPTVEPAASEAELAMLFEARRAEGSARFNVGHLHRIAGEIDHERLRSAVLAVVPRHQPLCWTHGAERLRLSPEQATWFDASDAPITEDQLRTVVTDRHRAPFDPQAGPLLRVVVRRLHDGTTAVLLAVHHVSADAAGLVALWRQVASEYAGRTIDPPPTDYAGFTNWQREERSEASRAYWLGRPDTDARLDIAPAPVTDDGFVRRLAEVSPEQLRRVRGVSASAVALTGLSLVLARRAIGHRLGVGVIASTRNHPAANDLVGYLLNTLPLPLALPGDDERHATFAEWAASTAGTLGAALGHRTHPFAQIVHDRRSAGRPDPTPEVLFAFDELPDLELGGAPSRHEVLFNGTAVGPLTVFVEVRSDQVELAAEYQGSSFSHSDVESLLADLDRVLVTGLADPDATIASLNDDLPSEATLTGQPLDDSIDPLAMIDRQLAAASGAAAVRCAGETLSWRGLDQASSLVARRLLADGVTVRDRVVVALPRSTDLIVAILGVLRAGASYVPIDPTYPLDRQHLIARTAGAATAIVGDQLGDPLTSNDLRLDDSLGAPPARLPALADDLEREAYAIFTSGSTGRPRGVPVSRRNLGASTAARFIEYPNQPERFLLISSLAFDSSVAGLFWTLAVGGEIVLPSEDEVHDPDALLALIENTQVTHTLMVPSLYGALLDRGADRNAWPGTAIVAGEACPASLVERHHQRRPESSLYNEYGPTEATVWSTVHRCLPGRSAVPIGHPIAGTRLDVVDESGRTVVRGVSGALRLFGPGVVDGYVDDAAATDEHFGETSPGSRYFLTGDRVVVRDDVVHFLGRLDDQLNVGGVRVEPGDIERTLDEIEGVGAVIVTATDLRPLDALLAATSDAELRRALRTAGEADEVAAALRAALLDAVEPELVLVAHLESDGRSSLDPRELRRRASTLLPANQRPRQYVVHDRLPRTPNGKLDRRAAALLAVEARFVEPDNDLDVVRPSEQGRPHAEADIAEVFRDVLGVDQVGPSDSFFDLGGHSVLSLRLLQQLERRMGLTLSVAQLYRDPTPSGVAANATEKAREEAPNRALSTQHVLPIQTSGSRPPVFGVHVLGRNGAFYRPLARFLGPDQPVYGLGLAEARPDETTPQRLDEVSSAYADEVERIAPTGPVALAAVSIGALTAIELARQLEERGRQVLLLTFFDAVGPDVVSLNRSTIERLRLHRAEFARRPVDYTRQRTERLGTSLKRSLQRKEIAARRRLDAPLPDRLKLRAFIEQNVEDVLSHRPEPVSTPILAIKAGDDIFTSGLEADGMGWNATTRSAVEVVSVPGGHLTMLDDDHAEQVALHLSNALDRAIQSAAAVDAETLEQDIRLALQSHRLATVIDRWRSRASELDRAAVALLDRVEGTARDIANASRVESERIGRAFRAAGVDASIAPASRLASFSFIRVISDAAGEDLGAVLRSLGYRPIGRRTATWIDVSGSHRVDLLSESSGVTPANPGADRFDDGAVDLGLYLATPPGLIGPVLDLAVPTPSDLLVDLGCGDGRVLIEAVRRYGCRARGVEIDAELAASAAANVADAGLSDAIEIVHGDATDPTVVDRATIVFAFLPPTVVGKILPTVVQGLAPTGRFITHEQLASTWPIQPTTSVLVVDGGITVAHRWDARSGSSETHGDRLG